MFKLMNALSFLLFNCKMSSYILKVCRLFYIRDLKIFISACSSHSKIFQSVLFIKYIAMVCVYDRTQYYCSENV